MAMAAPSGPAAASADTVDAVVGGARSLLATMCDGLASLTATAAALSEGERAAAVDKSAESVMLAYTRLTAAIDALPHDAALDPATAAYAAQLAALQAQHHAAAEALVAERNAAAEAAAKAQASLVGALR
eukprot:Rhum_TRINITY_DN1114_c0_g1::Rhum_TRINITY_DN1114_c0_g1_i1::g.3372::m.3372